MFASIMSITLLILTSVIVISDSARFVTSDVLGGTITFQIDIGPSRTTLTMISPSSQMEGCGIGFGSSTQMSGTYAVISDIGGITERILGASNNRRGTLIGVDINWSLDTTISDDGNGHKVTIISRDNKVDCSPNICFEFNPFHTTLPIIYAKGTSVKFFAHQAKGGEILNIEPTANPIPSIPPTLYPTNDLFQVCATNTQNINGVVISISIGRNIEHQTMKILINGPTDKWFGYGFGGITHKMEGSYTITVEDISMNVMERILVGSNQKPSNNLGSIITPSSWSKNGDISSTVNDALSRNIQIIRPINDVNTFDFTDFLTCNNNNDASLNMIYAFGNGLDIGYHGATNRGSMDLINICCTELPTEHPTNKPISSTNKPTEDVTTSKITTAEPQLTDTSITRVITSEPSTTISDTTRNTPETTTTNAPETTTRDAPVVIMEGFEVCSNSFGAANVDGYIGRNNVDKMMAIKLIGPSNKWFGFGFGSITMKDTYSMTVEGATHNMFERILSSSSDALENGLGLTIVPSYDSGDVTINDDGMTRTVIITRPYNVAGTYDFTDFLQCNLDEILIIFARGSSVDIGYHELRGSYVVHRECECNSTSNIINIDTTTTEITPRITTTTRRNVGVPTTYYQEIPIQQTPSPHKAQHADTNCILHIIKINIIIILSFYFVF